MCVGMAGRFERVTHSPPASTPALRRRKGAAVSGVIMNGLARSAS